MNFLWNNLDPLYAVPLFLYGIAFGSFLNVCIYRLAIYHDGEVWDQPGSMRAGGKYYIVLEGRPVIFYCDKVGEENEGKVRYTGEWRMSVVRPRSACPKCGGAIAWYDNVPVLSWLLLLGRCRHCKARISPRYVAVEILMGLLVVGCYAAFGLTLVGLKFGVLSFLLLGLIFTDAEHQILPDALTYPGIALGLLFSVLVPLHDLTSLLLARGRGANWHVWSALDAVVAGGISALVIWLIGYIWKQMRGIEAMGLGDVKLLAMLGAFLGLKMVIPIVFAASATATLFGLGKVLAVWCSRARRRMMRRKESLWQALMGARQQAGLVLRVWHLPFGTFLGLAAMVAVFAGNRILHWYLERFF